MREEKEEHDITAREAGRLGGAATLARYGVEHYRRIGRLGGPAAAKLRGPSFYAEIGRKGAATRLARYGTTSLVVAGHLGGAATKAKVAGDPGYYSRISRGRKTRQAVTA